MTRPFIKMHGLGNDFVIFDARRKKLALSRAAVRAIADRRFGIGCDQVIVMEAASGQRLADRSKKNSSLAASRQPLPTAFMRIYNADGGEVESCGNASRCVAWLLKKKKIALATKGGTVLCERVGKDSVRVDMGAPRFEDVGLSQPNAYVVNMGNPHLVFAMKEIDAINIAEVGPRWEHHRLFPARTNVSFAQVINKSKIKLRVWERGAGATLACGTAACATLAALHRAGLVSNKAQVQLPGGNLTIEQDKKTGHILMTGPVAVSFTGVWYGR